MKEHFDLLRATRHNHLTITKDLSLEKLNEVPTGFNNNLAWNLGHVIVTQQLLCYGLSGRNMELDDDFIKKYRKGSKPEGPIDQEELDFIKNKMILLVDKVRDDYQNNLFTGFKEYPTSYGITLRNIQDAIIFNNLHEAMHLGYMMSLKHVL